MRAVVTGAAGFVGSHLGERLSQEGWDVTAIDSMSSYYDVAQKRANAGELLGRGIPVREIDLRTDDLRTVLDGADVVFHQAGQPGVRLSWSEFSSYVDDNILATQRLLEASAHAGVPRIVYASSSSIYGDAETYPTTEAVLPRPKSPYGVTKLAAEHLCGVHSGRFGAVTVALRYFTVFGPRQRPDMAMHRLIRSALTGEPFPMFGTGDQVRDFTYVGDVVEANLRAATAPTDGPEVLNIAGGGSVSLSEVVAIIEELTQKRVPIDRQAVQPGDVVRTGGSIERASRVLDWSPQVSVREGLARQVAWQRQLQGV